jgi:tyrosinase
MIKTRRNVWELGSTWAEPVLWYARGVAAMKARPITDPTSWRFYGAMHGFEPSLWQALGQLAAGEKLPRAAVTKKYWKQCQHGSWYFLPWHRGYLLAFEAVVRAAVVELGGPASWALPYWNYFKAGQARLPAEFATPDWPDGGTNPLYVKQRYGPNDDSHVRVLVREVNLLALEDARFSGVANGGNPGFGGVDTGFAHGGQVHGGIESQPHDWVHGLVGGSDPHRPHLPGLMSDPDTAALDPIFWLHHANIDRLWASWNTGSPRRHDPSRPAWLNGPASVGQRPFVMPKPDGTEWTYAPKDVLGVHSLGYEYDDLSPTGTGRRGSRPSPAPAAAAAGDQGGDQGGDAVSDDGQVEVVGANDAAVTVSGAVSTHVRMAGAARQQTVAGFAAATARPQRVFLNLENVRGQSDVTAFDVYVGVPAGEDATAHPELLAGSIAPFGVRKASQPDGEHAGQGLTFVLDITQLAARLHAAGTFDVDALPVQLVPVRSPLDGTELTVGRISIVREG